MMLNRKLLVREPEDVRAAIYQGRKADAIALFRLSDTTKEFGGVL